MNLKKYTQLILAALCAVLLSACSGGASVQDEYSNQSAIVLYQNASKAIASESWKKARSTLDAIINQYPYSVYAQDALLQKAYVDWKDEKSEDALKSIKTFIDRYANSNPHADYAYYLAGMITFAKPGAFLTSFAGQKPSERDPTGLRQSYQYFTTLISRFPNSKYVSDARLRVRWLVYTLSQHDLEVATYYYKQGAYVAAINRAQDVLKNYRAVPAQEGALYVLYASYDKMDLAQKAQEAKAILLKNFPDSDYLKYGLKGPFNPFKWLTPSYWLNN